ncbi:MAG: hypothetical protein M3154_01360, partial [Candidatus Eremiobacteraeota bacterium]|nr:hypothetical protein [Candidatus Eremiobacteraeota bacterium]
MRLRVGALGAVTTFVLVLVLGAAGAAPSPDDDITGLWSYHKSFSTGLAGELTIARTERRWQARIGGVRAAAATRGSVVDIPFADGSRFRGTYERGVLRGIWARRAVTEDPRFPIGQTLAYTSPLSFRTAGRDSWRAAVDPLDDTFTLFLKIDRDATGALKAAFRNPDGNSHGPAMQLSVERQGDRLRFGAKPDAASPERLVDATLLHDPVRIAVM